MRRSVKQELQRAAFILVFGLLALTTSLAIGVIAAYINNMLLPSDNYGSGGGAPLVRSDVTTASSAPTVPDRDSEREPEQSEVTFLHRATPGNTTSNWTYLDHPLTNEEPGAVLLITRARLAGGADYPHEIGVWYTGNRGGRWTIFNQDLSPMPEGAEFEVAVLEGEDMLVHRATPANTAANRTYIDDPLTNGNPDVTLSVTQNWNPGGGDGVYNDHPVGTVYDESRRRWAVHNEDRAAMPVGAAFNVAVSQAAENTSGTATP